MTDAQDLRQFIREMMLRLDRNTRAMIDQMEKDRHVIREENRAIREENRVYFERLYGEALEERERTKELLAESRAQRAGFLRMLDRLDELEGGGQAPAG